jgi:hypothetical protein
MKVIGDVSAEYANAIRKGVVTLESFWTSLTLIRDFTFLKHVQVVLDLQLLIVTYTVE